MHYYLACCLLLLLNSVKLIPHCWQNVVLRSWLWRTFLGLKEELLYSDVNLTKKTRGWVQLWYMGVVRRYVNSESPSEISCLGPRFYRTTFILRCTDFHLYGNDRQLHRQRAEVIRSGWGWRVSSFCDSSCVALAIMLSASVWVSLVGFYHLILCVNSQGQYILGYCMVR